MNPQTAPVTGNRRRQYMINQKFQKGLMLKLALLVVGTILAAHAMTVAYVRLINLAGQSGQVAPLPAPGTPVAVSLAQILDFLLIPGLITALLATIAVLAFGLFYSHRIAGPLFNLKRMMNKVEGGNLNVTMRIRAADEFHDVESAFNQMVANLNQRLEAVRSAVQELPAPARKKLERTLRENFALPEEENKPELTARLA